MNRAAKNIFKIKKSVFGLTNPYFGKYELMIYQKIYLDEPTVVTAAPSTPFSSTVSFTAWLTWSTYALVDIFRINSSFRTFMNSADNSFGEYIPISFW